MKKIGKYLLSFILPLIILVGIFYFKGIFDDVEKFFVSDLRVQHFAFFNYLKSVLLGNSSMYYSFSAGMGSPMIATIIFYCLSPINLLLILIKDIRYAILLIYILKVCLSGTTMYILLKNKRIDDDNIITVIFSTCYALSSFAISYFFCIFWFDSLYLAPLVTLGIERIFKNKRISLLYILSLSLAIICNIQMGFGLCVYSVIYYLYLYNVNYSLKKDLKEFKQLGIIFLISSLCAGAISCGTLFGFISEYADISSARSVSVNTDAGVSNLFLILKNMFSVGNLKIDYFNNFEPYVYCGLIVSFLAVLYLFNRDIEKKKRYCALGVFLVFVISFSVNFINLFWHLSSPVLLNFRYSIFLCLFLNMLAYEYYFSKKKLTQVDILWLFILLIVAFSMLLFFANEVYILWSFLFLILIVVLLWLVKNKSKKFEILLFIVVIAEVFANGYLSFYTTDDIKSNKMGTYGDLINVGNLNTYNDDYRVMYNYTYTDNSSDSFLLNKNSLRYFSSVIDGDLTLFYYRNLSTSGNNNYRVSAYDSPLLLSLLGNRYFYLNEDLYNNIYEKVSSYSLDVYNYDIKEKETKNLYLYENPYALTLGYVIQDDITFSDDMNLVDYQNAIIKSFTGKENDVMVSLDYSLDRNSSECENNKTNYVCKTYTIKNHTNNINMYVYAIFDGISISNNNSKLYMDKSKPILISSVDKQIYLTLYSSFDFDEKEFMVTTYDKNNLINSLKYLQEDMLENVKINGDEITASIDSSKRGKLFLSIPYSDKFKIYVDNQEVDYYPLLDNVFLGFDIEEGLHDITIKYVNNEFKWYVIFSFIFLIITILLYFMINKRLIEKQMEEKRQQELLEDRKKKNKEKKKQNKKRK